MKKTTTKTHHLKPKVTSSSLVGCIKLLISCFLCGCGSNVVAKSGAESLFSPLDFLFLAAVMAGIFWAGWQAGRVRGRMQAEAEEFYRAQREAARQSRVRA